MVKSFTEAAGGYAFIVVYGDIISPLTMKAIYGGASVHNRLMMLLLKIVRIVMFNECCNTKGCPTCMDNNDFLKGNQFLKNRKEYYHQHKASCYNTHSSFYQKGIHRLLQCNICNTL